MRAAMIFAGVWLVSQFEWLLYAFGVFLIITGIKMLMFAEQQPDLDKNPLLRWVRGHMRITQGFHGERFSRCRTACAGPRRCFWYWC